MKVSTLVEVLLILTLIYFAAGRVIDVSSAVIPIEDQSLVDINPSVAHSVQELAHYVDDDVTSGLNGVRGGRSLVRQQRQGPPNRYCACTTLMCNCCRDFSLPVVPIKGPGCASVRYLQGDQMMVTMSFGDRVLRNVTISGKKPKPVCMGLPGGISKFCGRVYGISKEKDQFKACLGLELRALDDVEAALRVSCFKFGPQGLNLEPGQPLPSSNENKDDDDEDDDDDDDDGILGGDDDDDEDDEDDEEEADDSENDVDSDYTGFSALGDGFLETIFGGGDADDEPVKKKKKKTSASVESDAVLAAASAVSSSTVVPSRKSAITPVPIQSKNKITGEPQLDSVTQRLDESLLTSSIASVTSSLAAKGDEPVTSTSMTVNVVQKTEPEAEEEAEGTDKVMEVSSAKPGDVIQSKEDDDEDNDDENDDDDDDDLVDTAIKLVDDDDDDDDKNEKDDKEKDDEKDDDDDDKDDDEEEDEDDDKSDEDNKVDSNSKLEEVSISSPSPVASSTTSTVVKKAGVKDEKKKGENEVTDKVEDVFNNPTLILDAITNPLKSVTKTMTSTVAQSVASSLEDDKADDDDEEEEEARKIEADRQMRMAKILAVQEKFRHKVYATSAPLPIEPSRNSRQHKRMQIPTEVELARR